VSSFDQTFPSTGSADVGKPTSKLPQFGTALCLMMRMLSPIRKPEYSNRFAIILGWRYVAADNKEAAPEPARHEMIRK
jgi:hypothetical protein